MVEGLIQDWVDLPQAAARLEVPEPRLRQWLREGRLLALRRGAPPRIQVPAAFLGDRDVLKGLPGTVTLLRDAGFSDEEALRWLFTPDPALPGRPVDSLLAGRPREVHRRAQVAGF